MRQLGVGCLRPRVLEARAMTPAATVISITGNISANGGTITFKSTGQTYRIEGGNQEAITNTNVDGAGTIVFQADQVRLGTNSGPTTSVTTPRVSTRAS